MFAPPQSGVTAVLPGMVVMSRMYVILVETSAQLIKLQTESACYAMAEYADLYGSLTAAWLPGNDAALLGHSREAARLTGMGHTYTDVMAHWSASLSTLLEESLETCLAAGKAFDDRQTGIRGGTQSQDRRVTSVIIDFPDRRTEAMKQAMDKGQARRKSSR